MAKYETTIKADFDEFTTEIERSLEEQSRSLTKEAEFDLSRDGIRIKMVVYERFSYAGGNRASLSITYVGDGESVRAAAVGSGGSQATFFKINTIGEENFLGTFIYAVKQYRRAHRRSVKVGSYNITCGKKLRYGYVATIKKISKPPTWKSFFLGM